MPGLEQAPPILAVLAAAILYELGRRRRIRPVSGPDLGRRRLQAIAFAAALAVALVALASPLDAAADDGFWPHMAQHVLLVTVVAPLLVVAEPWSVLWRPLPRRLRRRLAGGVARGRSTRALRAVARPLGRPLPALAAFTATLSLWHLPWAFEQALQHQAVHDLEHLTLLASSVLMWEQAIDTTPLRPRLNAMERAVYLTAAAAVGWLLSVALAFWPAPLYSTYAEAPHRPGGVSALTDQQLAAGIMWGPGSISFSVAVFWLIYVWLSNEDAPARRGRRRRLRPRPVVRGKGV